MLDDATEAGTIVTGTEGSGGDPKPLPIARGSEIGRYVLLNPVGRGAAGQVWVAHDADLDRRVAIKVLDAVVGDDDDRRRRLLVEAQAMAKVRHGNVVAVFDVGTHEDRIYIAMELVEGTTLRAWCSAAPRSRAAILSTFLAAARGLAAAHAAGVIHRDFKPDNVLVERDAAHGDPVVSVKVADFGLAQAIVDDHARLHTGDGAGTPAYMSPEHHGQGVLDARSDQFSFCVALFEALWGHRPFRGDTPIAIAAATCSGEIDDTGGSTIPGRLRRVVLQGLAQDPDRRHASMDALIAALEQTIRRRGPWIAAAVGAAVIVGGSWFALAGDDTVDPCTRGAEIIAQTWAATDHDRIVVTPDRYAPAFVASRTQRLRRALDDYAGRWALLHDELCVAERTDPTTSGNRGECLEDRRASFAALTGALTTQPIEVPSIDAVLADLPALSACRETGATAWTPMPDDDTMRAPVTELRAELRTLAVQHEMGGDTQRVRAELEDLLVRAEAVGYPHLVASVEAKLGAVELQEGRLDRSIALLDAALVRALENGHERLAADVVSTMLMVAVRSPGSNLDVERLGRMALALNTASGGDDGLAGRIASVLATLRYEAGDQHGAVAGFERATAAWERAYGPHDPILVRPRLAQALSLLNLGDTDGALRALASVEPIIDASFDTGHEVIIQSLSLRATIADVQGDWRRAIELYREALEGTRTVGVDPKSGASTLTYNLAGAAAAHGLVDLARENLAASRELWPLQGNPVTEGEFVQVDASIALAAGQWTDAIRLADQAIALLEQAAGARAHRIAAVRLTRAEAQLALRRYTDVLATISTPDWDDTHEPHGRGRLGVIAATALHDPVAAARWLVLAEIGTEPALAPSRTLTRQLVSSPPTSSDARALATSARDAAADTTFPGSPVIAVFDEWIVGRWPPPRDSAFAPAEPIGTRRSRP